MRTLFVVAKKPSIEIPLKLVEITVQLLAKRDLIELLQDCSVEAFADLIRLRALHLRSRVIDVVDRQEELIGMLIQAAAVLVAFP